MAVALTYRASCDPLPDSRMPPSYSVKITVESPSLYVALIKAIKTERPRHQM